MSSVTLHGETASQTRYKFLVRRPDKWKQQLYLRGRGSLTARHVAGTMLSCRLSEEATAEDFDLPVEAVRECLRYCEENMELVLDEVCEERVRGGLD